MKGKVRIPKKLNRHIKINSRNVILFSLFLCGVIIGSVTVKNSTGTITEIAGAVFENIYANSDGGVIDFFCTSLLCNFLYLTIAFVFGACAVGVPVTAAIPAVKGLYLGVLCGYLYRTFGVTGIGYSTLIICPGAVAASALLIFACAEGMLMSIDLCYLLTRKSTESNNLIKAYSGRFGIFAIGMLAASTVDALFYAVFAGMFSF